MDPKLIIADKLAAGVRDFLEASTGVWTQDLILKQALEWATSSEAVAIGSLLANKFSKADEDLVLAKDAAIWNHELLQSVDASGKFAQATQEIRDTVWDYCKSIADPLTMYRVYASVPTNLMDVIQDITKDFQGQMAEGSFDAKNFNPMTLGQKVFDKLGPQQIQDISKQLMGTLGNDPSQLMRMMSSMQSMIPGGSSGMPGLSEMSKLAESFGSGGPNIASLMSDPNMMDLVTKMMKKD